MSEKTISEEQVLHNELSFEINQELIHLMKRIVEIQQENQQLKEKYEKLQETFKKAITTEHHKIYELLDTIEEAKTAVDYMIGNVDISEIHGTKLKQILDKAGDIDEKKN